jgi:hypothetical protein
MPFSDVAYPTFQLLPAKPEYHILYNPSLYMTKGVTTPSASQEPAAPDSRIGFSAYFVHMVCPMRRPNKPLNSIIKTILVKIFMTTSINKD